MYPKSRPRPLSPSFRPTLRALVALRLLLGAASVAACQRGRNPGGGAPAATMSGGGAAPSVAVTRGDFERRLPLTGEIDAVSAVEMKVPRVPNGKVPLRFLAQEGAEVRAGDVVAELDTTSFVQEVKDRTLQLSQAEIDLERQISQNGVTEADRALEVERKRAIVLRAEVDADVPEGILPKRDYLEKQLTLTRARVDLEKAQDALAGQRIAAASDIKIKRIAVEKLRRAVRAAEESIATLTLRAPAGGTVLVSDHPEERRKLQEGDDVFMGMTVARVTSSAARRVRAWLSDVDDGKIAPGMKAQVVLDAHPDRAFAGVVKEISPVARTPGDPRAQRRVFTVGVDLDEADAAVLRPGLSARVEVLTKSRPAALLAPRYAIDWTAEGPRVQLDDGARAAIALDGCNREVCVVTGGLDGAARLRGAPQ
jgi:HlyD family secretion protein